MSSSDVHQLIVYNHGMLALHAEDSVVVVADLDEYLITPKPMSVHQVRIALQ